MHLKMDNRDSISKSSQLLPMRMVDLLPNLLEIQKGNKSNDDCGFVSDDSFDESVDGSNPKSVRYNISSNKENQQRQGQASKERGNEMATQSQAMQGKVTISKNAYEVPVCTPKPVVKNVNPVQGLCTPISRHIENRAPNSNMKPSQALVTIPECRVIPVPSNVKTSVPTLKENNHLVENKKYHDAKMYGTPQTKAFSKNAPNPDLQTPIQQRGPAFNATPSFPRTSQNQPSIKSVCIKDKNYMMLRKLGSGGSSEVFKVFELGQLKEFALKVVNLNCDDKVLATNYINEINLLKKLQGSDRVIKLFDFDYCAQTKKLKVLLEVGETDLSSFLKARAPQRLPTALIIYYWQEMLQAVHHIHSEGIIHADLKPANFLLVCGRLKLIDFGIASAVSSDATSVVRPGAVGTFSYISPEALSGGAGSATPFSGSPIKISYRSDVWSLGCILYSMIYGKTPFGHITAVLPKMLMIVNPHHVIEYPNVDVPPVLLRSLKWCLRYDSRKRPTVAELLAIDLFAEQKKIPHEIIVKIAPHLTPHEFQTLCSGHI